MCATHGHKEGNGVRFMGETPMPPRGAGLLPVRIMAKIAMPPLRNTGFQLVGTMGETPMLEGARSCGSIGLIEQNPARRRHKVPGEWSLGMPTQNGGQVFL